MLMAVVGMKRGIYFYLSLLEMVRPKCDKVLRHKIEERKRRQVDSMNYSIAVLLAGMIGTL